MQPNYPSLKNYLKNLAQSHKYIRNVLSGNYQEILDQESRSGILYPLCWLEAPEINYPQDEDVFQELCTVSFVILINGSIDDPDLVEYNLGLTEVIAKSMVRKIICDQEDGMFAFDLKNTNIQLIDNLTNANDQGWRVTLELSPQDIGFDTSVYFDDLFPAMTEPRFSWSVTDNGAGNDFILNNLSLPEDNDFTFEWMYYDGTSEVVSTDEVLEFSSTATMIYFELRLNNNGTILVASAYFDVNQPLPGISFPFIYNPYK